MRIKNRIKKAIKTYKEKAGLSKGLALYFAINVLTKNYLEKHRYTINIRHDILCKEICNRIPQTLKRYNRYYRCGKKPVYPEPIWLCWLDGYDDMNNIIKRCTKSLFDNAKDHPVIFIDKNSVTDYITIPEHIQKKRDLGIISAALYCDVIRMLLLKEYGGLWVDADLYVSKQISEDFFARSFISEKNNHQDIHYTEAIKYIGKGNWSVQVIGGWKEDDILSFVCDGLIEYWENSDVEIDYFIFDYLIEIARRKIPGADKAIKEGAVDNGHYRKLNESMKQALPFDKYDDCISDDTTFNTLNWKREYPLKTSNNEYSIYTRFLMNKPIEKDILYKNTKLSI